MCDNLTAKTSTVYTGAGGRERVREREGEGGSESEREKKREGERERVRVSQREKRRVVRMTISLLQLKCNLKKSVKEESSEKLRWITCLY